MEQSEALLRTIIELQPRPRETAEGVGDKSSTNAAESALQDVLETVRGASFDIAEVESSLDDIGPFQNVFLQELERANALIAEMVRSLTELDLGFRGDLTMSDAMERLADCLQNDAVPVTWSSLAYPSLRPLGSWLVDLSSRIAQLAEWAATPTEIPISTWISGLFNPQAFLIAIMQTTAQRSRLELDKLVIVTDIMKRGLEAIDAPSRDGAYIHGLYLEGARWDMQANILDSSEPREMHCVIPVINCRAVDSLKAEQANSFACPVYKTQQRGPTYVFTANLRTKAPSAKWVLAGVVLVMDVL
jgi:dynein heavy chain